MQRKFTKHAAPHGRTAAWLAAPLAAICFCTGGVNAESYAVGTLKIDEPWTRATPGGAKVAGGFMRIQNTGSSSDRLIGGSLPAAGKVEVHTMSMDGGIMRMRQLADGLEIKPGETVELKLGSFHVMFMDLKEPLKEGPPLKGTLVFEKAGKIEVDYRVRPLGAMPEGQGAGVHPK